MEKYIYGLNPIREYIKVIEKGELYIKRSSLNKKIEELIKKAKNKNISLHILNERDFNLKFPSDKAKGIVLKVDKEYIDFIDEHNCIELVKNSDFQTILILDGIKDPGNLGAVLRSALLFDVDLVILPKDNSCSISDIVIKRSSGAALYLKIAYVTNLVRVINETKKNGYWIYAADKEGVSIKNIDFSKKKVIIIGEEGKGIRRLVKENSDFVFTIPTNGKLDSLNLSVSAGIILYELYMKNKNA